jgi:hypothetical protein
VENIGLGQLVASAYPETGYKGEFSKSTLDLLNQKLYDGAQQSGFKLALKMMQVSSDLNGFLS